jgi:hypothetical protein
LDLAPDFKEFCALLNAARVEFVIVGAHALALHGAPRYTGDLDVLVRPTTENCQRLLGAIAAFGFPVGPLTAADVMNSRRMIEMGVPPVQIHVMSHIDGVTWEEVWEGRRMESIDAESIPFIGRDALVRNKRAAGRPKDLADVDALRDPD